jgi:hypothetical protein
MASGIYTSFKSGALLQKVQLETDTIKCMLLTSVHAFVATHALTSDVSTNQIAASGNYTAGGLTLAGLSVTADTTCKWDATDLAWTSATFNASHAVLYDTTATASCLICSIDFGGIKTVSAGTFTIQWATGGIMSFAS